MHARRISRHEFEKLCPHRPSLEKFTGELVEWFADESNSILGAIDHERRGDTWSYAVLRMSDQGVLRVLEMNKTMKSRSAAERELFRKMEAARTN